MSYVYSQFVAELALLAGTNPANPYFVAELPHAIDYAEQRLFRDLDLIATTTIDTSQTTTANSRNIVVPPDLIDVQQVSVITPAGATGATGARTPLMKVSKAFLDLCFGSGGVNAGVPRFYNYQLQGWGAVNGQLVIGPWSDLVYNVVFTGTSRPPPLSATNTSTFFSTYLPDLFLIAAMIHMSAYQKNWAATGNDPAQSVTWETQYLTLLNSTNTEQMRVRYSGTTVDIPPGFVPTAAAGR